MEGGAAAQLTSSGQVAPEYEYETDHEDSLLTNDESSRPRTYERVAIRRAGQVDYIRVSKSKSLGVSQLQNDTRPLHMLLDGRA